MSKSKIAVFLQPNLRRRKGLSVVLAATAAAALTCGGFLLSASGSGALGTATLPTSVLTSLSTDGISVTPMSPNTSTGINASSALAVAETNGAEPSTTPPELATVNFTLSPYLSAQGPQVCWLVLGLPTVGNFGPAGYTSISDPSATNNFQVDFVNAQTGQWVMASQLYASGLSLTPAG